MGAVLGRGAQCGETAGSQLGDYFREIVNGEMGKASPTAPVWDLPGTTPAEYVPMGIKKRIRAICSDENKNYGSWSPIYAVVPERDEQRPSNVRLFQGRAVLYNAHVGCYPPLFHLSLSATKNGWITFIMFPEHGKKKLHNLQLIIYNI